MYENWAVNAQKIEDLVIEHFDCTASFVNTTVSYNCTKVGKSFQISHLPISVRAKSALGVCKDDKGIICAQLLAK